MDCVQTSTSTMDFDELSQVLQHPFMYPGNQHQNINGHHNFLDHNSQQMFAGSDNIFQETAYGAKPSSDLQIPTASVPSSCDLGLPVPSTPMALPQGVGPNFLGPSVPFYQGPSASGVPSFVPTSVQNPRFQVPHPNAHPSGQFNNQSMSPVTQQLSHLEVLCTGDTLFENTAQASDPGKVAELSPDIDLSPPALPFDVVSHLESLPTQDVVSTEPLFGPQPSAMTSTAGAAGDPLLHCEQRFNHGGMLNGGCPQGFPAPTVPYQCPLPAQFPFAPHAVPGPASSDPTLANASLQQVSRPTRKHTRGVKKPIPKERKDEKYYQKRMRNNCAAKRSRDQRKQREEEKAIRLSLLEREHEWLKNESLVMREKLYHMKMACNNNQNSQQ